MTNDLSKYKIEQAIIRVIGLIWCVLGTFKLIWTVSALGKSGQFMNPGMLFLLGAFQITIGVGLIKFKLYASVGIRLFAVLLLASYFASNGFSIAPSAGNFYYFGFPILYLIFFNLPSFKKVFQYAR